jgi:Leucine-rich repeat (LRR) protein
MNLIDLRIGGNDITNMPSLLEFLNLETLKVEANQLTVIDFLPNSITTIRVVPNPLICVKNKPTAVAHVLIDYPICP